MITKHFGLESKSIQEWHLEIRRMSHSFREKYERCFLGTKAPITMMHFWRNTSATYMSLNEVLYHIITYDNIFNEAKCLSCKHDPVHRSNLQRDFDRWYPWIIRCQDGQRFLKRIPSNYEVATQPISRSKFLIDLRKEQAKLTSNYDI